MAETDPFAGRDHVCFSHDWTGDPLSKTHLMRLLARGGRVLWVNSIGYRSPNLAAKKDLGRIRKKLAAAATPVAEVEPNLFVLSPLVIPAYGSAVVQRLNRALLVWQVRRAMRRLGFTKPVNWVFNPAAGILAGRLGEERVVYYCVDEYTAFAGVNRAGLAATEAELLGRADLVVVSAEPLLRTKTSPRAPTVLVRHGVDYDHFRTALDSATVVPPEVANLPRPVIGYFGLIAEDWVDVPLLVLVARSFPQGTLVLLGKSTMDVSALAAEPNVRLLGRVPYSTLPAYCKGFDAAVIPFPLTEVTRNANPLKAREYLAAGLPVVSTAIPEVEVLPDCVIGRTPEGFVEALRARAAVPRAGRGAQRAHADGGLGRPARRGPAGLRGAGVKRPHPRPLSETERGASVGTWTRRTTVRTEPSCSPLRVGEGPGVRSLRPNTGGTVTRTLRLIAADLRAKAAWNYERADGKAVLKALLTDGTPAMVWYRLQQAARRWRLAPLEMLFNRVNTVFCDCTIGRGAEFGPGFVLIHCGGVVINGTVRGGANVRIEHQVTIGAEKRRSPVLGDGVFLGAGSKVLGGVTIGAGAKVGANAVVVTDIPANATAVGIPARVVRRRGEDGENSTPA